MPAPVRALALLLLTASGALSLGAAPARAESFPMSASLAPRVDFWTRVYSEVGTNGGLIHDNEDLSLVYEVVRVPEGSSDRTVERAAEDAKARARNALRKLGAGQRQNLSAAEQRILAQFPPGVSSQTLRAAAERVRFQRGQADKFRDGLRRLGRWESYIRRALRERGVPEDLVALPHVESSYNPDANSHAGAAGLWQFTRPTGRLYMRVDYVVDERRDPFHASEAAARLLRNNYERLGTWPLAITAYNHGPGGLAKAVRQLGTRDIGTIVARYRSPSFGFASRNFYAEFLAARRIDQSPERYFGPIRREPPADHESVVLRQSYGAQALAKALHIPAAELQDWNPALLSPVWTGARNVPAAYELRVPRRSGHPPASQLVAGIQGQGYQGAPEPARVAQRGPAAAGGVHRVQPGETLGEIAERYGTSSQELADLNGIRNPKALREGQVLEVPGGAEETAAAEPRPRGRRRPPRRPPSVPPHGPRRSPRCTGSPAARRCSTSRGATRCRWRRSRRATTSATRATSGRARRSRSRRRTGRRRPLPSSLAPSLPSRRRRARRRPRRRARPRPSPRARPRPRRRRRRRPSLPRPSLRSRRLRPLRTRPPRSPRRRRRCAIRSLRARRSARSHAATASTRSASPTRTTSTTRAASASARSSRSRRAARRPPSPLRPRSLRPSWRRARSLRRPCPRSRRRRCGTRSRRATRSARSHAATASTRSASPTPTASTTRAACASASSSRSRRAARRPPSPLRPRSLRPSWRCARSLRRPRLRSRRRRSGTRSRRATRSARSHAATASTRSASPTRTASTTRAACASASSSRSRRAAPRPSRSPAPPRPPRRAAAGSAERRARDGSRSAGRHPRLDRAPGGRQRREPRRGEWHRRPAPAAPRPAPHASRRCPRRRPGRGPLLHRAPGRHALLDRRAPRAARRRHRAAQRPARPPQALDRPAPRAAVVVAGGAPPAARCERGFAPAPPWRSAVSKAAGASPALRELRSPAARCARRLRRRLLAPQLRSRLDHGLVGESDGGQRAAVDGAGVDADAEGLVPAHLEVVARGVAVDDRDAEVVRQVAGGAVPEQVLGPRAVQRVVEVAAAAAAPGRAPRARTGSRPPGARGRRTRRSAWCAGGSAKLSPRRCASK